MVRQTSREALQKYVAAGKDKTHRARILLWLVGHRGTRAEISVATGISLQSVCGRVNELIGLDQAQEIGRATCSVTGSTAMVVGPIEDEPQGRLF